MDHYADLNAGSHSMGDMREYMDVIAKAVQSAEAGQLVGTDPMTDVVLEDESLPPTPLHLRKTVRIAENTAAGLLQQCGRLAKDGLEAMAAIDDGLDTPDPSPPRMQEQISRCSIPQGVVSLSMNSLGGLPGEAPPRPAPPHPSPALHHLATPHLSIPNSHTNPPPGHAFPRRSANEAIDGSPAPVLPNLQRPQPRPRPESIRRESTPSAGLNSISRPADVPAPPARSQLTPRRAAAPSPAFAPTPLQPPCSPAPGSHRPSVPPQPPRPPPPPSPSRYVSNIPLTPTGNHLVGSLDTNRDPAGSITRIELEELKRFQEEQLNNDLGIRSQNPLLFSAGGWTAAQRMALESALPKAEADFIEQMVADPNADMELLLAAALKTHPKHSGSSFPAAAFESPYLPPSLRRASPTGLPHSTQISPPRPADPHVVPPPTIPEPTPLHHFESRREEGEGNWGGEGEGVETTCLADPPVEHSECVDGGGEVGTGVEGRAAAELMEVVQQVEDERHRRSNEEIERMQQREVLLFIDTETSARGILTDREQHSRCDLLLQETRARSQLFDAVLVNKWLRDGKGDRGVMDVSWVCDGRLEDDMRAVAAAPTFDDLKPYCTATASELASPRRQNRGFDVVSPCDVAVVRSPTGRGLPLLHEHRTAVPGSLITSTSPVSRYPGMSSVPHSPFSSLDQRLGKGVKWKRCEEVDADGIPTIKWIRENVQFG